MGTVLRFPGHYFHRRGGIAKCGLCSGVEDSLPSDCPGYVLNDFERKEIIAGRLDYDWQLDWYRPKPRLVYTSSLMGDSLVYDELRMLAEQLEVFSNRD